MTNRYDTQLLIEGQNLDEDAIRAYFTEHFRETACWWWGTRT